MRTWSHDKFRLLATQVERTFGLSTVLLEKSYTFMEMLSLIEHSALFIGNDSGPGVIAQAYGRPAFILFGATDHSKVLFSSRAHAVYADVGCNGCKQWHRNSLIECNSPQCLEQISVEHILAAIFRTGFPADVNAIHDCHV
jgi:ADP-heptose:LPS heptosyltransferase